MLVTTVAGVIGNEPEQRTIGGKNYIRVAVAHRVNADVTQWVDVMLSDQWHGIQYLRKGGRICATGNLQATVFDGRISMTIWASNYENLTPRM